MIKLVALLGNIGLCTTLLANSYNQNYAAANCLRLHSAQGRFPLREIRVCAGAAGSTVVGRVIVVVCGRTRLGDDQDDNCHFRSWIDLPNL